MKRGRDEDKVVGPLFPRLHVNDADNGGLRAPPRNKMALYELFSIPSQRSSSDAGGTLPRQPHQAGSLVPSAFRASQQRGFAVQVFELHRLIKVQKLIAGSPNQLLDDPSYFHSSPKSTVKDPSPSFLPRRHLQIKQKDGSHKVNESERATENTESANVLVNPQVKIVKQKDGSNKAIRSRECATENTGGGLPLPGEHEKRSHLSASS